MLGQTALYGFLAYLTYYIFLLVRAYLRESSRKFNARSTGDQVMKNVDLSNKYAIITGCNSGLGKETARIMVSKGCTIIMACRNSKKAEKAKDEIIATFPSNKQESVSKQLILMKLDLGSLQSVFAFCKDFVGKKLKCDYLILNAGIMALPSYQTTTDNIERQWGVNHLSHWYLTKLLLKPVLIPNKTRVVSLSSYGHKFVKYDELNEVFTDCIKEKEFMGSFKDKYNPWFAYGISKASNILFARHLNTLYKDKGIISVSCHPGFIQGTALDRSMNPMEAIKFLPQFFLTDYLVTENKSIPQGVATTLRCVGMSNDEIIGGEFYYNCISASVEDRYFECAKIKNNDDILAMQLWKLSLILIENNGFKLELD